jgi:8-oxo-dGTP diphosphatase
MPGGDIFAGHLRVRVNALIIRDNRLLLVEIASPTRKTPFWMPPGGAVQFGEHLQEALVRETLEETGLDVQPLLLKYITEYIHEPYHAVEFYFRCEVTGGRVNRGTDPELGNGEQIIRDIRWVGFDQMRELELYPEFLGSESADNILDLDGGPRFISN